MSINRVMFASFINTELRRLRKMLKADGDFTRKKLRLGFSEMRNLIKHRNDGYNKRFDSYVPSSLLKNGNVAGGNPFK